MNFITIYFGEKPFYITNYLTNQLKELLKTHATLMLNQPELPLLKKGITDIQGKAKAVVVLTGEVDRVFEMVKSFFTFVQAGGGLVKNESNEYLFIFRRGKWDLPKGKLEAGENIEECAIREVKEETGITELTLGYFMLHTWHVYEAFGEHVLKQSSWYEMDAPKAQQLVPQLEEDIQAISWVREADWHTLLHNTFPSIKDVLGHHLPGHRS